MLQGAKRVVFWPYDQVAWPGGGVGGQQRRGGKLRSPGVGGYICKGFYTPPPTKRCQRCAALALLQAAPPLSLPPPARPPGPPPLPEPHHDRERRRGSVAAAVGTPPRKPVTHARAVQATRAPLPPPAARAWMYPLPHINLPQQRHGPLDGALKDAHCPAAPPSSQMFMAEGIHRRFDLFPSMADTEALEGRDAAPSSPLGTGAWGASAT